MLYNNITEKILGMQDIEVKKVEENEKTIEIYLQLKRKEHKCPCCGNKTNAVHDYRQQKIKDIPSFGKNVLLHLNKRRYRCVKCQKRFYETNTFLAKYKRTTKRLVAYIINSLRKTCSFKSVAEEVNLSSTTVIRYFDTVSYSCRNLPSALSIDEFKGNTGSEKYQCILTDPVNKKVLDILPKRHEHYLSHYFNLFSKDERNNVKYFVSDMWKPFSNTASVWFKNATQIVDKYHWIRQVVWAFENVRKQEQLKFSKSHRIYFKHSRKLLIKHFSKLTDEQKQQVNIMLYASPTLSSAYSLKEDFFNILNSPDRSSAQSAMTDWINCAYSSDIPQFQKCASTLINWSNGILNSFSVTITNGFTEGCNNKIKVLKRNAFGFRNFYRFRNRILHIFA